MKKLFTAICIFPLFVTGQIMYQDVSNQKFSLGSYGRVGADWSFENGGSIGRRLNLNNMGSIGGRLEEQDYLELAPALHFSTSNNQDSTQINVQTRFAVYSNSLATFGNSSSSSLGGLTIAIPEIYAEAKNVGGKGLNVWIGARLYRGGDLHIADHFYFNDHSGQGYGIEYKNTRFCNLFVSSTDTSSSVPPYFYLNIATGTPSTALRQRSIFILEHDLHLSDNNMITMLAEAHYMANRNKENIEIPDSLDLVLDYGTDYGLVFGARLSSDLKGLREGSYNKLALRYGNRIANGGDGGMSRTWLTYGAPDLDKKSFAGAYSISLVDEVLFNFSEKYSLNAYIVLTSSMGAAASDSVAKTYYGKEVYNKKLDLTIGLREVYYVSDQFHLMGECHYSQRKEGNNDENAMVKFSIAPTYVPTGGKDFWARPHFRFIASAARYNDAAMKNLYSPYLAFVGEKRWGYYFGIKAEWWIW